MTMLPCTEENVLLVLDEFQNAAASMFGRHAAAAEIGISGTIDLVEIDGPVILVQLSGRFWHRRETVLRNADTFVRSKIPEVIAVDVVDPDDLLDQIYDDETGALVSDRRSPDWNGDRETLEYQGLDPDSRGPFGQAIGHP